MPEVSLATRHTIVSMAARGRRSMDIADRTTLPVAVVRRIAEEYGAPDLGKLAWASDELRRQLDGKPEAVTTGAVVADGIDALKAEAERIGDRKLVRRAERIATLVDQLRVDTDAAVKAWEIDAAARAKRDAAAAKAKTEREAKIARLAELMDEEAKLRAEISGPRAYKAQQATRAKNSAIREWAATVGVECSATGRIPASVHAAYTKAVGR